MRAYTTKTNFTFPRRETISLPKHFMYQSIPSLNHSPGPSPRDSHVITARGSGFRPTFFVWGVGVLNQRN